MKLIVERAALLKALNHMQTVVERRTTIPILSNVLLAADSGKLALTVTDLELELREKIDAEVATAGTITAPAHMLYDIVRKLPDGAQISLTLAEDKPDQLTLVSGKSTFSVQSLPQDEFPAMASDDAPISFALAAEELSRLIEKTRFAVSTEETRYYLNGIYLHALEDEGTPVLRAVATDGHRLARVQAPMPVGAKDMPAIIVPRKTVTEVQKLLEDAEGEVSVQVSDTKIIFTFESIVLTSKLIDGKFPDYTRVIPTDNDKELTVDAQSFAQSVDRVAAISSEKSRGVRMSLEADSVNFNVLNPHGGSAYDELSAGYASEPLNIGFNARYLLDVAEQIDGDTAVFQLGDAGTPTIVRDSKDANALYIIMPMRV